MKGLLFDNTYSRFVKEEFLSRGSWEYLDELVKIIEEHKDGYDPALKELNFFVTYFESKGHGMDPYRDILKKYSPERI